jgi:hypothetical protein
MSGSGSGRKAEKRRGGETEKWGIGERGSTFAKATVDEERRKGKVKMQNAKCKVQNAKRETENRRNGEGESGSGSGRCSGSRQKGVVRKAV